MLRAVWHAKMHNPSNAGTVNDAASLRVVADQYTCPTYAGDLAAAVIMLTTCKQPLSGVYHYCGGTKISWHGFAQRIFACAKQLDGCFPVPKLEAIIAQDYAARARRPAYSVLSCEKI